MANEITEPEGFENQQGALDNCDQVTQKIISFEAGMADGSIVTLFQVVDKDASEIQAYRIEQAKIKCSEIVDKILAGTSTNLDISQFDVLTKYIQNA